MNQPDTLAKKIAKITHRDQRVRSMLEEIEKKEAEKRKNLSKLKKISLMLKCSMFEHPAEQKTNIDFTNQNKKISRSHKK
jgi:predicted transcriptional regulator